MNKLTSNLLSLEVGHVFSLTFEEVVKVLSELPHEQQSFTENDTTVFNFALANCDYTLINTGSASFAVKLN